MQVDHSLTNVQQKLIENVKDLILEGKFAEGFEMVSQRFLHYDFFNIVFTD